MRLKIYFGLAALVCACSDVGALRLRAQAAKAMPATQAGQEQATTDAAAPQSTIPVADYPLRDRYIDWWRTSL
jgi:hypothetical protein